MSIQAQRGRSRASTSRPTQGRDREILTAAPERTKKQPFMVSAKTGFVAAPISYPHRASQTMASPFDRFGRPHPSPHLHDMSIHAPRANDIHACCLCGMYVAEGRPYRSCLGGLGRSRSAPRVSSIDETRSAHGSESSGGRSRSPERR